MTVTLNQRPIPDLIAHIEDMYQLKGTIDGVYGNVLSGVSDVNKAMRDGGVNELPGHPRLVLPIVGNVNDGDVCDLGHVGVLGRVHGTSIWKGGGPTLSCKYSLFWQFREQPQQSREQSRE